MKKLFSFILILLITFLPVFNINNLSFADSNPSLTAEYAVLMEYETGQVLYSKNGYSKLYPASTTKAWTAYVVLKHVEDLNQVVEIKDLPIVDGSSMYLKEGEAFTVKELLDALLIHSSNDVAMVLAKYVSGSVENFVSLMNDEAKAIGAKNTHFNNPHGLPDDNHYTTAYDMALMARKAMDNEIFRDIVKTKSVKYPATEAIRVISAVFKSTVNDLYLDSRTLLDYGFDNFYVKTIVDKDEFIKNKNIFLSKEKNLTYQPKTNYSIALPNNSTSDDYSIKTKLDDIKLPIKEGDKVGTLDIYKNKKLEKSIDLVAKNDVTSIFTFITGSKILYNILKILLLIAILIFIVFVTRKGKKKKKKNIYSRNRRRRKH